MTDQTPEDRDRELELLDARDRLVESIDGRTRDLAAILIVRPQLRPTLLHALAEDDAAAVTLRILAWVDELLLPREADELHTQLELQAEVALGTTLDGLTDLDKPPVS